MAWSTDMSATHIAVTGVNKIFSSTDREVVALNPITPLVMGYHLVKYL